jgi:hypothetical protein
MGFPALENFQWGIGDLYKCSDVAGEKWNLYILLNLLTNVRVSGAWEATA